MPDPYGKGLEEYNRCLRRYSLVAKVVDVIIPHQGTIRIDKQYHDNKGENDDSIGCDHGENRT
ncbi:MAG: hypothetical protein ACLT33_11955 [Lachnospira pectinoschiza]